jgi:hypothetical protein
VNKLVGLTAVAAILAAAHHKAAATLGIGRGSRNAPRPGAGFYQSIKSG